MNLPELGKWAAGLAGVGLSKAFGSHAGRTLGILAYHRIAAPVPGLPRPMLNVSPERFRQQLVGLVDRGFEVWPLRKVLQHRAEKRAIPPRTVVLTFDDAYETVYLNAWPVLEDLRLPATVFLSTAYLDGAGPFPFDPWGVTYQHRAPPETYRPLRTNQCREMVAGGLIDLGAHTHTHRDFRCRPDAFQRDLQKSVELLQTRFGLLEVMFAFPYGGLDQDFAGGRLEAAARRTNVICGLTTENVPIDPNSDPFRWGRFGAYDWDSGRTLAAKLEGWYSWAPRLYEWFLRCFRARAANCDAPDGSPRDAASRKGRRPSPANSTPWGFH